LINGILINGRNRRLKTILSMGDETHISSPIHQLPDVRITKMLHDKNNAALMRRYICWYVSAYGMPIESVIEY